MWLTICPKVELESTLPERSGGLRSASRGGDGSIKIHSPNHPEEERGGGGRGLCGRPGDAPAVRPMNPRLRCSAPAPPTHFQWTSAPLLRQTRRREMPPFFVVANASPIRPYCSRSCFAVLCSVLARHQGRPAGILLDLEGWRDQISAQPGTWTSTSHFFASDPTPHSMGHRRLKEDAVSGQHGHPWLESLC